MSKRNGRAASGEQGNRDGSQSGRSMRSRRQYLAGAGAAVAAAVAGCLGSGESGGGSGGGSGSENGSGGDSGSGGSAGTTAGSASGGSEPITILLTPENPTDVKEDYMPMQGYLEDRISGLEIEYRVPTDYSAILPALKSKQAEIGMDDITLIAAPDQMDVLGSAVTGGTAYYFSLILAMPDSGIEEVNDIEGKTMAFADPLSTSGSIYALYELKQAGLAIGEAPGSTEGADFEGNWSNHEAALQQLTNDKADACSTWGGNGMAYVPKAKIPQRVREKTAYMSEAGSKTPAVEPVLFSEPIPKQPVYTRKTWNSPMKGKIEDALLAATEEKMNQYKPDGYEGEMPFTKLRDTTIEDYQPVIKRVNALGIDLTQES